MSSKNRRMLVKIQIKSCRVKGLSFHPTRPWILSSLHNGVIQLWDYRMETMIATFEEHDGPVRGVDFHSTQPLFVSGGDDKKVKVWNYQLRRCMFTLGEKVGHLDYIRTVQFHKDYPWILSASDDQTIRIWNWQARTCISVLTGHNHYVMCAQFHPSQDLVVSCSLDQTIRVWDISGLRSKTVSIQDSSSGNQNDLFGSSDVMVKHVVEGHSRGVNWVSFHRTHPLIVSGADDREVKLWRMNDVKIWDVDTMRGHINNVSCVIFHPKEDLIISNSEDKSIRVWDISRQNPPIVTRRDNDRYWILEAHSNRNLLAAGHDSGLVVFKLARERPPLDSNSKKVYYFKGTHVHECDLATGATRVIFSTRSRRTSGLHTLQYNYSNRQQHSVLLTDSDGAYELYTVGKSGTEEEKTPLRGFGRSAVFVSSKRFAVLDKNRHICIHSHSNAQVKSVIKLPNLTVTKIFSGGSAGRLLLRTATAVLLYDVNSPKILNALATQSQSLVKYVVWSSDKRYVALFSVYKLYIADSKLQELCTISESTRIKSGAWDRSGVFVFSTSTHLKYLLPNGDVGIIRTLPDPIYITAVIKSTVYYIGRDHVCASLAIDCTEYLFKVALMKKRHKEVLRLMESKALVGRSIISYLQKKGYPEVALHFVQDPKIKFNLALECGNIAVALECASAFDNDASWHKLGVEALRQGNHQVVEAAYQKTKNFERLSFLYLITGNIHNLSKMLHISKLRGDVMARFQNALYLGDIEERVDILSAMGRPRLAYILAKTHGLQETAQTLADQLAENTPSVPVNAKLLQPPIPILRQSNWPLLEVEKGFFDEIEEGGEDEDREEGEDVEEGSDVEVGGGWGGDDLVDDLDLGDEEVKDDEEGDGWGGDLDLDLGDEELSDVDDNDLSGGVIVPSRGKTADQAWSNSSLPADLVAAGNFQMAMHMLNRQLGVVNFEPLRTNFMRVYQSARGHSPALPGLEWNKAPLFRDPKTRLPALGFTLAHCVGIIKNGYKSVTEGKFQKALSEFRSLLSIFPLLVVAQKAEIGDVEELRNIVREYVTALRVDLARKEEKDTSRKAALAAYFTKCSLQPVHRILGYRVAIKFGYKMKNYKMTASFCRNVLELAVSNKSATVAKVVNPKQIRQVLKQCDKVNTNAKPIDFDESKAFVICARTFTPIYTSKHQKVVCPFCRANYHKRFEDSICDNCTMCKIGSEASGLRVFPQ